MSARVPSDKPVPPTPPQPPRATSPAMHPNLEQRKDQWLGRNQDNKASLVYQPHSQPRQVFLHIRISTIEKAKKDLLVRFDAQTNLPHLRASSYPGLTRTYRELCLYSLALSLSSPAIIVPALPLPSTTASGLEDTRILRLMLGRWFQRILAEPSLRDHPETRNFIEADFAYCPTPPGTGSSSAARKRFANAMASAASVAYGGVDSTGALPNGVLATSASAGSRVGSGGGGALSILGIRGASSKGLATSRSVYDDDQELVAARAEVTRLEMQFADAAEASEKLAHSRRSLTAALTDLSIKLNNLGAVEEIRPPSLRLGLPYLLKRTAYTARSLGELQASLSHTELLTIGDAVAYQSINARAAKETMLARNALVEEHHHAQKATVARKRELEHVKIQSNLSSHRVDHALLYLEEARSHEFALAHTLRLISVDLHQSLQRHSRFAHADLQHALVEYARGSLIFQRQMLSEMRVFKAQLEVIKSVDVGSKEEAGVRSDGLFPSLSASLPTVVQTNASQSMHSAQRLQSGSSAPTASANPTPARARAQSSSLASQPMFPSRTSTAMPATANPHPLGASGTASGTSRLSAAEAARSLAGKF
ncbi:hypothetical protein NDA18_001461 [Ustilago nuda]|nr:hypothetical protein NDA18_001461 [Ustilago nuda]